ncbi:MAG: MATE family efflux transporter [Mycoplasmatales bacterium]
MLQKLKINSYHEISKLFWPITFTLILTNTLSFVDTFMIANYSLLGPAAITTVTQIMFIFGPIYFAMLSGVNIYAVQYFSRNETDKLKKLSGIALTMILSLSTFAFIVVTLWGHYVVHFFSASDQIYKLGMDYLFYYKFVILIHPIDMYFTYQYRAIKRPKIPLIIGTIQSLLNIIFNIFLIYGLWIFPECGIAGAAMGTLLTKIIIIIVQITVAKKLQVPFLGKILDMFSYSKAMFVEVFKNTIPLMIVEFGFGLGNVIYFKFYTTTSDVQVSAFTIAKNISYMINAFVMATANVSGILAGTAISTGVDKASSKLKQTMSDLFKFMTYNSIIILIISFVVLPLFVPLFLLNTNDTQISNNYWEIFKLIYALIIINGIWMAIRVFASSLIAILKSGNDNKFVMLVDAGSTYIVGVPVMIIVYVLFQPSIIILRSLIILEVITKVCFGVYRYRQKKWVKKLD